MQAYRRHAQAFEVTGSIRGSCVSTTEICVLNIVVLAPLCKAYRRHAQASEVMGPFETAVN